MWQQDTNIAYTSKTISICCLHARWDSGNGALSKIYEVLWYCEQRFYFNSAILMLFFFVPVNTDIEYIKLQPYNSTCKKQQVELFKFKQ